MDMHQQMAATLETVVAEIRGIQRDARANGFTERPRWPMIILRSPKGWTGPKVVDGKQTEGTLPLASGADGRHGPTGPREGSGEVAEELPATRVVRQDGPAPPGACGTGSDRGAPHERQSPRQRGPAAARPATAGFPGVRRHRAAAGGSGRRGHARPGPVHPRRDRTQPRQLSSLQPGRNDLEPLERRIRGDQSLLDRGDPPDRRPRRARWSGDGDVERAPVRRMARRLPAHGPPRVLLLLRGVHSHHRFHVQPARQVVEGLEGYSMASVDRLAQLSAHVPRLAAGPQRLQPSGPRLHRPCGEQEGRRHPGLSAARCEHAPLGHRPLSAQPQLRQRHRRRQAAVAAMARHGRGGQALHRRPRHLAMGQQRSGRRAGHRHGVLRGRAHAGDARGGRVAADPLPRP